MTTAKGGARLMLGFDGLEPSEDFAAVLRETEARSVILFARNIADAEQCRALIAQLRALVDWPLLVAVDQEGGAVVRLTSGATVFPGNMALGAADDVELARRVGAASGAELAHIGFDLNLGPVVDLQTNPANPGIGIRSFGSERARASALARAWIEGHAEHGVACCLKHFPGKGAASVDAHLDLPVLEHALEDFREPHLAIFEELCDAEPALTVMTTHLVVRGLDPDLPATLSSKVVRGLLRGELGFGGLVIADDLEMGAIDKHHGVPEAARKAAIAGHDVLPICHREDRQRGAARALQEALDSGELDLEEHRDAVARIEAQAGSSAGAPAPDPALGAAVSREVCDAAVHVFADARRLLPIAPDARVLVLAARPFAVVGVEEAADRDWDGLVARALADAGLRQVTMRGYALDELEADGATRALLDGHADFDRVLLLTWNARGSEPMRALLAAACDALAERLVVAHLRNPFDQAYVPEQITALSPFGYRVCHIEALARAVAGKIPARGRMPAPYLAP